MNFTRTTNSAEMRWPLSTTWKIVTEHLNLTYSIMAWRRKEKRVGKSGRVFSFTGINSLFRCWGNTYLFNKKISFRIKNRWLITEETRAWTNAHCIFLWDPPALWRLPMLAAISLWLILAVRREEPLPQLFTQPSQHCDGDPREQGLWQCRCFSHQLCPFQQRWPREPPWGWLQG